MRDHFVASFRANPARNDPLWFAAVGVVSLAAVGTALVSQYVFDLQPCPWCVLQRLIFVAVAAAALLGCPWRASAPKALAAVAVLALSIAGMAAALWQHFRAAASASCNLTLADKIVSGLHLDTALANVFEPRASCSDAAVDLLGVPYDFWSLALFCALGLVGLLLLRRQRR